MFYNFLMHRLQLNEVRMKIGSFKKITSQFPKINTILLMLMFSLLIADISTMAAVKIKFATVAPEGTTWMNAMHDLNQAVKNKTGGRVEFIFYPGGIAGDEKDVLRKMRYQKIHATAVTGVGMGIILPKSRILDLPFLFNSEDEIDTVHSGLYDFFTKEFSSKNFELLAWSEVGMAYLFSNKAFSTPEELKSLKVWAWEGDPIALETFKAMGITPVSLPITDVLTSLQTGLIDTIYSVPLGALALQWHNNLKYVLKVPMVHSSGAFLIDSKIWGKISKEDQVTLKDLAQKTMSRLTQMTRKENAAALQNMTASRLSFIEADENFSRFFGDISQKTLEATTGTYFDKELYDNLLRLKDSVKK